jgi:tetratricopeptide (TPR) repeat protein
MRLAETAGDKEAIPDARVMRLRAMLELGDIEAAYEEMEAIEKLAEELRRPWLDWFTFVHRAMRSLFAGRFDEGERLAQQALAVGQRLQQEYVSAAFQVQMFISSWEQGRLDQLEPAVRFYVEQRPNLPAWRCALAFLYSESGQKAKAEAEFERLAANGFTDLPQDLTWLIATALLSEVCASLGDARRAEHLYALLAPYGNRNVIAPQAFACLGSASRYLGLLASTMRRWDDAERHFQDACVMNIRMLAHPSVAYTRHDYARMMLARNGPGDRVNALALLDQARVAAGELGMKALVERSKAV